ncbi:MULTISPECIES: 3-oxoacyl-ACP synthase III family protein [Streptomyces]|uniref:3-oxoacyl-ACP synthase III family protein n=1 Tax=Streptomyces flaveolus TaxID=67297 RepID=A0ABV3AMB1_9ACTN|nr:MULTISPECIES: 3-oxoacyl-ACP synthase III family protein [Streptomyces]KMS84435.1 3-oxoacyl-ACP synthase [Streptomyces regensis]KOG62350.1 3-oxoacyl-ACP synthase [Streptomyces antibioticus]KOV74727.1 3-oxoacyl-ACP synthase [Streptomyces sp. NRRL WC-3723]
MTGRDVYIRSAASALPGAPVDNAALARCFGMDALWEQWVDVFIGTGSRHLALDLESGKITGTLAELAEEAGRKALDAAGVDPGEVDAIVLGTATPDRLMPATVNMVADRLGIDGVRTFQLQSGCSGAVQALDVARQVLLSGSGETVLVLGGDVIARFYDVERDLRTAQPAELVNYVLFGDAAGAAVLSTRPAPGAAALREVFTRLVGLGREPGAVLEWFGPADRDSDRPAATEDYKAIERHVPQMTEQVLAELLDTVGWGPADVDVLLPPQLSGRMTKLITERLALPGAHEVTCVDRAGNCGNAIVFLQLERALADALGPGRRAVGISIESSKWIKAGFALEGC